ncbi:unnamed protein product [Staurois parvus]|uniref:Uncharacterized protein n=1 Tax=Staurois parvus TaxID=386267 RepID=A0ABN9BRH6_9NEOB|nr:unnamed protein product [Staurois parvus]
MQHCTHMKFLSFFLRQSFLLVVFNPRWVFCLLNKPKTTENFEKKKNVFS